MSNGEKRRGLWIDPRTKILLLLLCVLSATMAPSLLYEMLVVALVACFGIVCGKVRYSIIGVIVYTGCQKRRRRASRSHPWPMLEWISRTTCLFSAMIDHRKTGHCRGN